MTKFKSHYKHVKKINEDAKKVMSLLKDLAKAQAQLTEDVHALFDSGNDGPVYQGSVQLQYVLIIIAVLVDP